MTAVLENPGDMPRYLPHYHAMLASLTALNEWTCPRAVLRYQAAIVQQGEFQLDSPWTGNAAAASRCVIANNSPVGMGDIVIAYYVPTQPALWVCSGGVKDGFPLTEVYLPVADEIIWSSGPEQVVRNAVVREELRSLTATLEASVPEPLPVEILLGHPNFAHGIWNELAGIERWLQLVPGGLGHCRLSTIYQPLLPVARLFAGQLSGGTGGDSDRAIGLGLQPGMVTRLGATRIPKSLRERLQGVLSAATAREITEPVVAAMVDCWPVVWMSVRLDSRTSENQDEFLTALVKAISRDFPRAGFLLDGFSLPADIDQPIYDAPARKAVAALMLGLEGDTIQNMRELMETRERAVTAHVAQLTQALDDRPRPVVNVSGLGMVDATYLARLAHYYVCHAGTLQHKVAWIYDIPGTVHSNTASLGPGVAQWLADQLEDGRKPSLLSQTLVSDRPSIRGFNQVERNRDYRIADIDAAVREILEQLRRAMLNH